MSKILNTLCMSLNRFKCSSSAIQSTHFYACVSYEQTEAILLLIIRTKINAGNEAKHNRI